MRWNTPLSDEHATLLLNRLAMPPGACVLDVGCGWGELLLRAVAAASGKPAVTGIGVDTDAAVLDRARVLAAERGLSEQVRFVPQEASTWRESADRVICLGASHALGGTERALTTLAELLQPGGRLLFGDGCWEKPPTEQASAIFGAEVLSLAEILGHAHSAGWRLLHLSTACQREWDEFEISWAAGRQDWLLAHPNDEQAQSVHDTLDAHLNEYVNIYRGVLGFCCLVLAR
jgi:cyclopropane fatty-acyl-phospholipid synthase-like methyltransferase